MRRLLLSLLVVSALMVVLGAAGCGGAQTAGLSESADQSPEAILTAAVAAAEDMTSAQGNFEFNISFDVDTSQLPEEAQGLVGQPMTIAGTLAYASDPQAMEFTVAADLLGQTLDMGMKVADDKAWFRFLDQWYEAPAEMQELMGSSAEQDTQMAELQTMLSEAGIDPMTWMKDLRLVGEETLDGVAVYHLAASPDIGKMMTDLLALMQNEQFMGLLDPTGSSGGLMGAGMMPAPEELQQMEDQLASMFESLVADVWIGVEDSILRQATIEARMVPPAGEDADGLNAINLSATILLQGINQPITVEPPASALPWSEFEKALQENPGLFMGGLMGGLGGIDSQTY